MTVCSVMEQQSIAADSIGYCGCCSNFGGGAYLGEYGVFIVYLLVGWQVPYNSRSNDCRLKICESN